MRSQEKQAKRKITRADEEKRLAQKKKEEEERRQREIGKFVSFFCLIFFDFIFLCFPLAEEKKQRDMEEKRKYVCPSQPYITRICTIR